MYYGQTRGGQHPVMGPPPTSPGYAYTNGVPMGAMGMPHTISHHHQNSLSHFPSPPTLQALHQGSPSATMISTHWQTQIHMLEASRATRSPHHRSQKTNNRGTTKSAIPIMNPSQPKPEEAKEEESTANHPSSTVAPVVDSDSPTSTWDRLDMGGVGVKNLPGTSALFRFSFLKILYLNHNSISVIPPEICALRSLESLDLSGNQLSTLPVELGMLTSLRELLLFDNQITTIPPELGTLHQLHTLGVEGNPLDPTAKSIIQTAGTVPFIAHLRDTCRPPLFPPKRQFMSMISEKEQELFAADPSLETFSVLCYNILCERAATERMYGYTPSYALQWDFRKRQILKQMITYNSDFLCLQEIDVGGFEEFFVPNLEELGYEGMFWPKARAKTMTESDRRMVDGCAIFYRRDTYQLVEKRLIEFGPAALQRPDFNKDDAMFNRVLDKDHIGVIALFENKHSGTRLVLANAHTYWNGAFRDVKLIQTVLLLDEVQSMTNYFAQYPPRRPPMNGGGEDSYSFKAPPSYTDPSKIPVVVCGDFNSKPDSGVYEYLSTGYAPENHPDFLGNMYGSFQSGGVRHRLGLRSAYKGYPGPNAVPTPVPGPFERWPAPVSTIACPPPPPPPYDQPPFESEYLADRRTGTVTRTPDGELPFTNYTSGFEGAISYIWHSAATLGVNKVLGEVDRQYLSRVVGFPNIHFPSDHIPIIAEFRVKATATPAPRSTLPLVQSQQSVF